MSSEYFANAGANANAGNGGNSNAAVSRWLTEEVFKLIEMVKRDEAIYNPRHKYYFCRPYVENFWREVDQKLEKNPGASLAKWTNLRISFRREYTNYLEEKVPPCWTYFDSMFFLHPYLRKKQQPPKSLDSMQGALAQFSRLQRASAAGAAASMAATNGGHSLPQEQAHRQLDNYLDYIDDAEHPNSELDDIIDDEPHPHSLNNDIKSECDENADEFDAETRVEADETAQVDNEPDADETEMRTFMLDSVAELRQQQQLQQYQQRMQYLNRLHTRACHDDYRAKRPRSHDSISSSQQPIGSGSSFHGHPTARGLCSSTPTHSNVSFVRPTFSKPMDVVSTTTSNTNGSHNSSSGNHPLNALASNITHHAMSKNEGTDMGSNISAGAIVPPTTTTPSSSAMSSTTNAHHYHHSTQSNRLVPHHYHHHHNNRLEISSVSSAASTTGTSSTGVKSYPDSAITTATAASNHVELCDCKTDPDAMFLMSLLPDIQKLNGRDRGKIKIAFQNILQDYLYPD